ncbi:TonB-dependent receptor [Bordetella genomosp. 1]|uniref:TonB-dependent siderophore receptor n=1 Tax=Bordetella genomosp. 1 TaxID=1395607 RepID=A0ABX4ETB2_9BORD|nr:TonB-dependent receptor [Bordetella genomosp. 1]OZI57017.1 TonB-dependent siderophore receptor [Bordetella genomosp. 1]
MKKQNLAWLAAVLPWYVIAAQAQTAAPATDDSVTLNAVKVEASADASASGLAAPFAGGQVATGSRIGILGTRSNLETPFSTTAYTNELIQDKQAHGVGDVLQNDPGVRVARGFGNFQESYFIRGFLLGSDDIAYNGLFGLLPRQYVSSQLFERVEVLRGASAFLTGASPNGGGIGGMINLVPKRAPNEPLNRFTVGYGSDGTLEGSADVARRFGPDDSVGIRLNLSQRGGESGVDDEFARTTVFALGLDWRSDRARISADLGYQNNRLKRTRPNVTLGTGVTSVPDAPKASSNYAQDWSFSNERDVFGTLRGEYDFNDNITGWAAYGMRKSKEENSLANVTLTNGSTGAGNFYRFDNAREDTVNTGEIGLRAKAVTGPVKHEFVVSASHFELEKKNAYVMDFYNRFNTNIYDPVSYDKPTPLGNAFRGNDMDDPAKQGVVRLTSYAVGDTLSFWDDRVVVTAGLRHQRLYSREYAYNTGVGAEPYEKSRNSPAAGIVFRVTPEISLYGNYIEALVAGDTAPLTSGGVTVTNGGAMMSPYVSKQKEVGIKYERNGLGGGLAYFNTDKPRGFVNDQNTFVTSGKDRHQGLELTTYGEVTRSVRVLGGVTWIDAKQRSTGSDDTDGKRVIGVPKYQANLGVEWDIPGVEGLTVDGRMVYTGSSYADSANTLKVPSWTRFDAGVRYMTDIGGHLVTWRARVENIANRDYWASVGGYPNNGYLSLGGPRTFSLSASMEF